MNSKTWKNKALSLCLVLATITTYSMVALAGTNNIVGEILVSSQTPNSISKVKINGEAVRSGQSIFSSSTIVTPDNTDAVVNLGNLGKVKLDGKSTVKLSVDSDTFTSTLVEGNLTVMSSATDTIININEIGKVKLSPKSAITLAFDGNNVTGKLLTGEVTALNTSKSINLMTNGKISKLNTGDTVKDDDDDDDDDDNDGGAAWAWWLLLIGGAAAGIIFAASSDNNRIALGDGATVISPNR